MKKMMVSLQEKYRKEVVPAMQNQFGYRNVMAVPRISSVVVTSGVGHFRDQKQLGAIASALGLMTGQRPAPRPARVAIAAFKTRRGQLVAYQVTLRGRRMWDFLARLIHVALPRSRDFRGISPDSFDRHGNLTLGLREHMVFPEMIGEDAPFMFGLGVTVVTTATKREAAMALLKLLGFPIRSS